MLLGIQNIFRKIKLVVTGNSTSSGSKKTKKWERLNQRYTDSGKVFHEMGGIEIVCM